MFLKVSTIHNGKPVDKHVNVLMCTIIHDIDPTDPANKYGHKSVLYNSNGYASYSNLSADTIISAIQGQVFTEDFIQQQQEVN
jgi:hypothetical protein